MAIYETVEYIFVISPVTPRLQYYKVGKINVIWLAKLGENF